ncbi:MAG TPA: hypothetical protein VMK12_29740 [Anaeromyxobacteraceae bacterium]|nr:hypothetical protein [Anaeromyxobacteraceae bacterium]
MKQVLIAASVMALSLAAGCDNGDHTCEDLANAVNSCAVKLNVDLNVATTRQDCETSTCANKQATTECVVNLDCGAGADAYNKEVQDCETRNQCRFF